MLFQGNAWERRSRTLSSQTLFIFISVFYMYFILICNTNVVMHSRSSNAFFKEKTTLFKIQDENSYWSSVSRLYVEDEILNESHLVQCVDNL